MSRRQRAANPSSTRTEPAATAPRRRWPPLLAGAGVVIVVLALAVTVGRPWLQRFAGASAVDASGRLVLPTEQGLTVYHLPDGRQSDLIKSQPGQSVSSAAWSPDGSMVAYSLFHRRPGDQASVQEIFVASASGGDARVVAERDRPGTVLDTPVWSPDGQQVYFSYFGMSGGRTSQRVERVGVSDGARQTVVENGYAPAVSPDGQSLLFLSDERAGTGLWRLPLGGGERRVVLPPGKHPALAIPRFSPDGQRLVVAIMNSSAAEQPPGSSSDALALSVRPFDLLLPAPAYAHGQPWDIWTFDLQGGDPRRLTQLSADDPSPTWSPDGRHVAFWSGNGLFVVRADGSNLHKLLDRGGYGAIDWAR